MGYVDIDEINRILGSTLENIKDDITPSFYSGAKCMLNKVNEMAGSKDESRGCDGDGDEWNALCDSVAEMIEDINVSEIADHLNEESLFNWCGAWREEAKRRLEAIREYGNR